MDKCTTTEDKTMARGIWLAGDNGTFQVYNRQAKKCLSIVASGLHLEDCTRGINTFFNWTYHELIKGAYSGYQSSCIQAINNTYLTTGDCSSQDTVRWTCEESALRSETGNWYLSWNAQKKEIEMTETVNGLQGQWVIYETDNNICYFLPHNISTTTAPFTQPTTSPRLRDRNSAQLWPRGYYALPKAENGCPGNTNFTWKEGWVFQDLDDNGEIKTKSSPSFNMAATIDDYGNIKRWFCSKNVTNYDIKRPLWPKGTYCIYSGYYSSSNCPETEGTFIFGSVTWDNQYWINNSKNKGLLPRGEYISGGWTRVNFCCQSKHDPNIPVSLPTDQPFYLLAHQSSICQKVQWATVTPQYIVYDTSDKSNGDRFSQFIPFNARRTDPMIYYCYYQGCNHTLNFTEQEEGKINFPETPFMDMISQTCSWRIQFSSEFVIALDFLHFNIPSNQSTNCSSQFMEVFDGEEQADHSLGKWCGTRNILNFTSQSNSFLIILKLDKNVTNTTGFHLNFQGISTQEKSSKVPDKEITTVEPQRTERPTSTSNTDISKTEENYQSAEPPLANVSGQKFSTTAIVVPIAVVIVIGIILVSLMVIRKRRKNDNSHIVTFQNNGNRELNPIYEGVDNDITSPPDDTMKTKILTLTPSSGNLNPLYESSEEAEYSSTVNSLYASNDC